jgi:hypothetical protein
VHYPFLGTVAMDTETHPSSNGRPQILFQLTTSRARVEVDCNRVPDHRACGKLVGTGLGGLTPRNTRSYRGLNR